jgi:hypothetical protein
MSENPYAVNASAPLESPSSVASKNPSLMDIARSVFLAWEKLRVIYVAILCLMTLALVGMQGRYPLRLWLLIFSGAVVANLAYFAGPIAETYIRWLGYQRTWPRWFLFIGGTLLSLILTVGMLAAELLPNQP